MKKDNKVEKKLFYLINCIIFSIVISNTILGTILGITITTFIMLLLLILSHIIRVKYKGIQNKSD